MLKNDVFLWGFFHKNLTLITFYAQGWLAKSTIGICMEVPCWCVIRFSKVNFIPESKKKRKKTMVPKTPHNFFYNSQTNFLNMIVVQMHNIFFEIYFSFGGSNRAKNWRLSLKKYMIPKTPPTIFTLVKSSFEKNVSAVQMNRRRIQTVAEMTLFKQKQK